MGYLNLNMENLCLILTAYLKKKNYEKSRDLQSFNFLNLS